VGQGSKRQLGRPVQAAHTLDLSQLAGVTLFEPEELVLSAKAGTPINDLEALLDEHNQEFQFEPADLGPLLGLEPGLGTVGGVVNTNLSGPKRLKYGSVRDHILGISAISGRGEVFKSGGRVVKNVTGYDLSKGVTGSYGTLAVLTDITLKVLPKAETEKTLVLHGLDDERAVEAMALAMGSSGEVSGAAHLPASITGDKPQTFLRVDGFDPSVKYRVKNLSSLLSEFGDHKTLTRTQSRTAWEKIRDCSFFVGSDAPIWRLSCTPSCGPEVVKAIRQSCDIRCFYDWQGGMIWVEHLDNNVHAATVRKALADHGGGHATLIRADRATRLTEAVFQPQPLPLAALSKRYRENFDPKGILNPGRMF